MNHRMDLHCHSTMSDGTAMPSEIVRMAAKANLGTLALTDHDTMSGIPEAAEAGRQYGVLVLPSVEIDSESPFELHILGLDVDPKNPVLCEALLETQRRRRKRNAVIVGKLKQAGYEVEEFLHGSTGNMTRLHIAMALRDAGYAPSVTEAFKQFLNPGKPGYYLEPRLIPKEAISLVRVAGGIPVLAHPCHIRQNPHQVVAELTELGIMGLEAYHPASTIGQTETFVSLAAQFGLLVTCGSDFHGKNREGTPLGCTWREVECLIKTAELMHNRHNGVSCH